MSLNFSKVELLTALKDTGIATDGSHEPKVSEASLEGAAQPRWSQKDPFEFHVNAKMLLPGQAKEQLLHISLFQTGSDGKEHTVVGSYSESIVSLYHKYRSLAPTAEIVLQLKQEEKHPAPAGADGAHKAVCTLSRGSAAVAKIRFDGDWSTHPEVYKAKQLAKVKESQEKAAKLKAGVQGRRHGAAHGRSEGR